MALIAQDAVDLTPTESTELSHRAFAHRGNRADAKRALAIMLLAAGESYTEIQKAIGCSSQFVARWKSRFLAERLAGLEPVEPEARRGKRKQAIVTPQQESRVLAKSRETPPNGADQWTPETLGRALRIDPKRVARIWQAAGIDPKRVDCFRDATDASFDEKHADLIGLYVQGPQRVAIFASGDASAAKAAAAGRNGNGRNGNGNGHANGNGHHPPNGDIAGSGSLSLYAMLNGPRGLMRKPVAASPGPTSRALLRDGLNGMPGAKGEKNAVSFIDDVLKKGSPKRTVHVFVEGLDDRRAADLRAAFRRRAGVQLHVADSYATWLNQVDIWLAKIDRDFVAGKVLTRHAELRHRVMQTLRATEKRAQGLRWTVGEV